MIRAVKSLVRRWGIDIVRYQPPTLDKELGEFMLAMHRLRGLTEQHPKQKEIPFFDFCSSRYRLSTVEHNFTADRTAIHSLLSSKGLTWKFEALSFWDDWYVASNMG